jgi:hypothetical protein
MDKLAVVDIDGCLCDYPNKVFFDFIEKETSSRFESLEDMKSILHDGYRPLKDKYRLSGLKRTLALKEGALDVLHFLKTLDYKILIFTSRPKTTQVMDDTYYWLIKKKIPFDFLFFSRPKEITFIHSKTDILLIDDDIRGLMNYKNLSNYNLFLFGERLDQNIDEYENLRKVTKWEMIKEELSYDNVN